MDVDIVIEPAGPALGRAFLARLIWMPPKAGTVFRLARSTLVPGRPGAIM
jgi:hypothetical protein